MSPTEMHYETDFAPLSRRRFYVGKTIGVLMIVLWLVGLTWLIRAGNHARPAWRALVTILLMLFAPAMRRWRDLRIIFWSYGKYRAYWDKEHPPKLPDS